MAVTQTQTHCDRCGGQLVPGASYCERCGERTRRARGMVRLVVRIEVLVLGLMVLLTAAFAWIFLVQGYSR